MDILLNLQKIDTQLFFRVFRKGQQRGYLRALARVLSRTGDGYLHLLLPTMMAALKAVALLDYLVLLGAAIFLERLCYVVLKNTLRRRRPQDFVPGFRSIVQASDKFSFPSGHTSAAFCLSTTTGIIFGGPFVVMYLWASSVALSRVLLGVHFPGDTVAGAIIGSSIAVLTATQLGFL